MFGRVQEALSRLREVGSAHGMIARAPKAVAEACDMDRVVIYRIEAQSMVAEAFFVSGDPQLAAELLEYGRANPAPLDDQVLEREMLRRRQPMVIRDAPSHPSTYKPYVERFALHSYVAAPIMPEGRVIGFLHADKGVRRRDDPRGVDELDRDALWAFAEGFGYAVERDAAARATARAGRRGPPADLADRVRRRRAHRRTGRARGHARGRRASARPPRCSPRRPARSGR